MDHIIMLAHQHPIFTSNLDGIQGGFETFMHPKDLNLLKRTSLLHSERGREGYKNKLSEIYYAIQARQHLAGDIVEFGVFQGSTMKFLATLCPNRTIHGFDTFNGLTGQNLSIDSYAGACVKEREGEMCCPLSTVQDNLSEFNNINLTQCDARFPTQFINKLPDRILLAHMDMDLYHPTIATMPQIWNRITDGGIIIFDDFGVEGWNGIWKAVYDFCEQSDIDKRQIRVGAYGQAFLEKF
jgi:hypothetical protein